MARPRKSSGAAERLFFPVESSCDTKWLQSSENKLALQLPLLWINDVLNMPPCPGTEDAFTFGDLTVKEVDIFGSVITFERIKSFYTYHVDDGTGVIICALHEDFSICSRGEEAEDLLKTTNTKRLMGDEEEKVLNFLLKNVKRATKEAKTFQVGDTVRVTGSLIRYDVGVRIVAAATIYQIKDLTTEAIRIEATHKFYKDHKLESFVNCRTYCEVPDNSVNADIDTDSESLDAIFASRSVESGHIFTKPESSDFNAFSKCCTKKQASTHYCSGENEEVDTAIGPASTADDSKNLKSSRSEVTSIDLDIVQPIKSKNRSQRDVDTTVCDHFSFRSDGTKADEKYFQKVATSVEGRNRSVGTVTEIDNTVGIGTLTDPCKLETLSNKNNERSVCVYSVSENKLVEVCKSNNSSSSRSSSSSSSISISSSKNIEGKYKRSKPSKMVSRRSPIKANSSVSSDCGSYPSLNVITKKRELRH